MYFAEKCQKMVNFRVQIGELAVIRAWAFIGDSMVFQI